MAQSDLDNIAYNKFANGEITLTEYIKYQNRDKIMEKKEAMKILKDFRDKSALFSVRTALDIIIPELKEPKESEDEKIRKEIIYFLSRNTFQFGEDINKYKSWIAWLEKQDKTFTKKDVDDAYLKGVCNTKHELEKKSNTNKTINKGESAQGILRGAAINLITWIDYNAAEGNMCLSNMECKDIEDALVSGNWDKIYAYIKKKLEKQDNKSVNIDIESMVSSYKQRLKSQGGVENSPLVNMCLTAFRHGVENTLEELNLKEVKKQGEQKPAEWSEEDELMLLSVIQSLELTNGAAQIKIDWLKSLKQRLGQGLNPNEVIEWLQPYECVVDHLVEQFKKDFKL